jgi:hypothetical protein
MSYSDLTAVTVLLLAVITVPIINSLLQATVDTPSGVVDETYVYVGRDVTVPSDLSILGVADDVLYVLNVTFVHDHP